MISRAPPSSAKPERKELRGEPMTRLQKSLGIPIRLFRRRCHSLEGSTTGMNVGRPDRALSHRNSH